MKNEDVKHNLKELYRELQVSPAISARDYRDALRQAVEILTNLEEVIKTLKDHKYHHAAEIVKEALKNGN